jgi:hypothetical protein
VLRVPTGRPAPRLTEPLSVPNASLPHPRCSSRPTGPLCEVDTVEHESSRVPSVLKMEPARAPKARLPTRQNGRSLPVALPMFRRAGPPSAPIAAGLMWQGGSCLWVGISARCQHLHCMASYGCQAPWKSRTRSNCEEGDSGVAKQKDEAFVHVGETSSATQAAVEPGKLSEHETSTRLSQVLLLLLEHGGSTFLRNVGERDQRNTRVACRGRKDGGNGPGGVVANSKLQAGSGSPGQEVPGICHCLHNCAWTFRWLSHVQTLGPVRSLSVPTA